jgi:3-methyladenine DNA glycosylase AlkD
MFDFYLSHTKYINNWDLVDLTAPVVVGEYLANKQRDVLYRLAESDLLWDNRIAVVATLTFIRNNDLDDIYQLAIKLMNHPHDLMHKAIGWMLREAGKRDEQRLFDFVDTHRDVMPRTMLRYAIEKFPEDKRKYLMMKNQ